MDIQITHIDTAYILLDIGGFRILTDPVFDDPGRFYHFGFGTFSRKYSNPAKRASEIGPVDLVLLTHDQHHDNLDREGRKFLKTAPKVFSTQPAARRLAGMAVTGMEDWEAVAVPTPRVKGLKLTAVPAQHAPFALMSPLAGKVLGFVLEWEGQSRGAYYISGDTVLFPGVREVARRFPRMDTAILHLGGVQFPYLTAALRYTFNSKEAVQVLKLMNPARMIPVHYGGWWHFRETPQAARKRFTESGFADRILWLEPGRSTPLDQHAQARAP